MEKEQSSKIEENIKDKLETSEHSKKDETPNEKIKPKTDPEEGLLGGGIPDPSPA